MGSTAETGPTGMNERHARVAAGLGCCVSSEVLKIHIMPMLASATDESMSTAGALARSAKWRKVMLGKRWYEDWEAATSVVATSSPLALNWVVHCKGRDPALLLKGSLGGAHLDAGFKRQQVPQTWWRLFWSKTQYGAVVSPAVASSGVKDYYEMYLPQRENDGSKFLDAVVSSLPFLLDRATFLLICRSCLIIAAAASETRRAPR